MQLDVESLRTFLAVLDTGGMTSAASSLNQSQSAVSWRMKRLEERAGRALLIRDGHDFRPTRDGRALLEDARTIVELHDRSVARLQSSELTGTIRLGANQDVGATHMASILGRFRHTYPGATVEFVVDSSKSLTAALQKGQLDVAVIQVNESELRPTDQILWTDQAIFASGYEARYKDGPVPMITFGDDCFYRQASKPILAANGIENSVAFSAPSSAGVVAAVEAGLGVAVLSAALLNEKVIAWERAKDFDSLPKIYHVARTVAGENPKIAAALVEAIDDELSELVPNV